MKIGVNLKIDVTKIDKEKLFNGAKGTYLDAQVFIEVDQQDQYGHNGMITQAVNQEERQQGVKGAILGNCKVFWNDGGQQPAQQPMQQQRPVQQVNPYQQQQSPQQWKQQQQQQNQMPSMQNTSLPPMDEGWEDEIPFN